MTGHLIVGSVHERGRASVEPASGSGAFRIDHQCHEISFTGPCTAAPHMARSSRRFGWTMPAFDKDDLAWPSMAMPSTGARVVCAFCVTMAPGPEPAH